MSKTRLVFTGERLIPRHDKGRGVYYEHLARYIFAAQLAKDKDVYDLGCGSGFGSRILSVNGGAKSVFGVDRSEKAVRYARATYGGKGITFKVIDLEKGRKFLDVRKKLVVAFEIIEHLYDQDGFVKFVKSLLSRDGIAMFSTPNDFNCPYENVYHIKQLKPRELKNLLQRYFRFVKIYHQTFEFCQTIRETGQSTVEVSGDSFMEMKPLLYGPSLKENMSQSLIAVCSGIKIPDLELVALNSSRLDGFDMRRGSLSLNTQAGLARKEVEKLKNRLDEITLSKYFVFWPIYVYFRDSYRKIKNLLS